MIVLAHAAVASALVSSVVAEDNPDQLKTMIDDAGPVSLLFIVLLGVAVFFLLRSMVKQMKRIDPSLPEERAAEPVIPEDAGPDDDVAAKP